MRLRIVKLCCLVLALTMGGQAMAQAGQAYTDWSRISQLNPREFGMDLTLPQAANPMQCGVPGTFRIKKEAANYDALVAMLMSAAAQGKPVRVYVHQCDWDGGSLAIAVMVDY